MRDWMREKLPWVVLCLSLVGAVASWVSVSLRPVPVLRTDLRIHVGCAKAFFGMEEGKRGAFFRRAWADGCTYPPVYYYVFRGVLLRPTRAMRFVWDGCLGLGLLLCFLLPVWLYWRDLGPERPWVLLCWAPVVWLGPFESSFAFANPSPVFGALQLLALWGLWSRWRGGWLLAGVCLGFVAGVKLYALCLVMYLLVAGLWRGRRSWVWAAVLACVLFFVAQCVPEARAYWVAAMDPEVSLQPLLKLGSNNALIVLLHKLGLRLPLWVLVVVLGGGLGLWILWREGSLREEYGTLLAFLLIAFPVIWNHSYVVVTLPLFCVLCWQVRELPLCWAGVAREVRLRLLFRGMLFVYVVNVFVQAEFFVMDRGVTSLVGQALACAMPFVLVGLLLQGPYTQADETEGPAEVEDAEAAGAEKTEEIEE